MSPPLISAFMPAVLPITVQRHTSMIATVASGLAYLMLVRLLSDPDLLDRTITSGSYDRDTRNAGHVAVEHGNFTGW
jgi:hypothetical protein